MEDGELLRRMTLEEKADFVAGSGFWHTKALPRLGIEALYMTDGPHGLRCQALEGHNGDFSDLRPATAFPTASLLASSFDPALLEELGRALALECEVMGVSLLLGPGANIKRSPLAGRNFEYFSEDPLLLSTLLAGAWIRGLQSLGIGASLKHFAANNQEKGRMLVDVLVEARALREIYLASFEGAIREAKPVSVMCAYNSVNGDFCSQNHFLTKRVLREDWGFEGFVLTDWGASDDRVRGLEAGVDLEMPESQPPEARKILAALREGRLGEGGLDESVLRLLGFVRHAAAKPGPRSGEGGQKGPTYEKELFDRHHELARRLATSSMVLLKNEGPILPLRREGPLGLIGELARSPRYQGAGSSYVRPTRLVGLHQALEEAGLDLPFAPAYRVDVDRADPRLEREALALAKRIGEAGGSLIVVLGLTELYEGEGFDRSHLGLPANQAGLVESLAPLCPNLVVVYVGGAPIETPWLASARALLAAYLGGQASGPALVDLLFGAHNPEGRLAETWPLRLEDSSSSGNFPGADRQVLYKEGLFVGYRWFSTAGIQPRFPFGHGLSYTNFAYSDAALSSPRIGADATVKLSLTLANIGARAGAEVVQVYLSFPDSALERPRLGLAAFQKIRLEAGESRRVEIEVGERALRYWDEEADRFLVENGRVLVLVGASSADLRLELTLLVEGGSDPRPRPDGWDWSRHPSTMPDRVFEARLGRPLAKPLETKIPDLSSTLGELGAKSHLAAIFLRLLVAIQARSAGAAKGSANYRMFEEMLADLPLKRLSALSQGRFPLRLARTLCLWVAGRPLKALHSLLEPERGA